MDLQRNPEALYHGNGKWLLHGDSLYKQRGDTMGRRSDHKKLDEIAAWDLDKGCRRIVNQFTPARRRLKKQLARQARKRINKLLIALSTQNWV